MLKTYTYPEYAFRRPPELSRPDEVARVPLVVIGAGPVGLAAAIDAAQRGVPVVLLDDDKTVSIGSRGLCYAKRTLEILDRLGQGSLSVGQRVVDKGQTWNIGRTFFGDEEVFRFNLLPEPDHRRPGMVNLQQYYLEQYLVECAQQTPGLDLRWCSKVVDLKADDLQGQVQPGAQPVQLRVETPQGSYELQADWVVVADGARSPIRRSLGLDIEGQVFKDRFLIADVVLDGELFEPGQTERWFWFDPPFHRGQSVLLHREADQVWRIDFQLGWDADPELEKTPERVIPRIRAMLDHQGFSHLNFELEWVSVYTFQCRRMGRFRHGRLLFAGDAAHQVSPFGARGANSGIQDADNLMWKLAAVIQGRASWNLLDTYHEERALAADENILNSTRSTDFITPKSAVSKLFRDAVLDLAPQHPFARGLVNSGRLSVPTLNLNSSLNTADADAFEGWMVPGAPADDAPMADGQWLLSSLPPGFVLLKFVAAQPGLQALRTAPSLISPCGDITVLELACQGVVAKRYDARENTCYLLRPDGHVAARFRSFDEAAVRAAQSRAMGA